MDSIDHSLLQVPEADHLPGPPLPPRSLYINLHDIREERPSDSSQHAESNRQRSPSLQPSTPHRRFILATDVIRIAIGYEYNYVRVSVYT